MVKPDSILIILKVMSKKGKHSRITAIFLALFVVFLWATSWVLIKIGLQDIPPLTFAGLRYTLAFLCLLPAMALTRGNYRLRMIPGRTIGRLVLLGLLLYACTQGAAFVALSILPAITVNLFMSFTNVLVALLGVAFLAEIPTRLQWAGVVLATTGAMVYFYPATLVGSQLAGTLVVIFAVISNAVAAILGRDINRSAGLHPLVVTVISMGAGSIVLLLAGIATQGMPPIAARNWAIIAWLAVVNTAFAFTLWNYTLRTLTAVESSMIYSTMLIWIPLLAVVFLDEQVTRKEILGLVMAGAGTLMVQMRSAAIIPKWFNLLNTDKTD